MPQISTQEFEQLPLRVHEFLAGVPLHDVWAVDLQRTRSGITLDEFLQTTGTRPYRLSPVCARAFEDSALRRTALGLGSRAGHKRVGELHNAFDNRRSLEVAHASGHAPGTFPRCIPLRKRAAPRSGQPHRPRCGAERARRVRKCLPLLFRRICAQRQPSHAHLHDTDRPVSKAGRLSVTPAQHSRDLEPKLRESRTTPLECNC